MLDSVFVDIFLCPSCDISHVALGGGATALYEQRLWRNMPLTFDILHVLYFLCVMYIYGFFSVLLFWHIIRQYILPPPPPPPPLYQPLYIEFIVSRFDIKRAAATFAQFACTLHVKHNATFGKPQVYLCFRKSG